MNEKNKAILVMVLSLGAFFYLILAGLDEKNPIILWVLGAFFGMSFNKLQK